MSSSAAASVLNRLIQNASRPKPPKSRRRLTSPESAVVLHLKSDDLRRAVAALSSAASPLPPSLYIRLLRLCANRNALVETRRVESHIVASHPSPPPTFVLNRAVETYAACGSLNDARELFDEMPHRDGGTWNSILSAYSKSKRAHKVLALFSLMNRSSVRPNDVTFACVLGSCADLLDLFVARQVHSLVVKFGFISNVILGTSLVDVYGKCWLIDEAREMFESIEDPNAISWNVIVRRYLELGRGEEAVVMFFRMVRLGVSPMSFTISNALIACSDVSALRDGCRIHGIVLMVGFEQDNIIGNSLMEMYAKNGVVEDARRVFDCISSKDVFSWTSIVSGYAACGRIEEAEGLFEEMPERNVVSWNAMLAGYVQFLCWEEAISLMYRMQREIKQIDPVTLGLMLSVCAGISDLERGKQLHAFAHRQGFCSDQFFSNALLDMYAKCGSLRNAERWFIRMASQRDRVSWNSLLSGYARHGRSDEAFSVFREMQWESTPNRLTFTVLLAACANIFMLEYGKQFHGYMIRNGFEINIITRGALVDMYSKCRSIEYAIKVFKGESSRDIIIWNSIILGCAYNGRGEYGLDLFEAMQKDGIKPDNVTFAGVLLSCISEGYVDLGRRYFDLMNEEYGIIPRIEHYECMIELFGKHGFMVELEDFIGRMPFEPTIPMWTRIFDSCREHGNSKLGERAAKCINESNPLNPVRFEVLPEN